MTISQIQHLTSELEGKLRDVFLHLRSESRIIKTALETDKQFNFGALLNHKDKTYKIYLRIEEDGESK